MSIANLSSTIAQKLVNHSPAILTAVGAAGVIGTALLTGKAFVQATDLVRETEQDRWEQLDAANPLDPDAGEYHEPELYKLTPKEKVELTWKIFVPPLLAGTGTLLCVISAQSINSRRSAALLSLYTVTERARTEFQEKAREVLEDEQYEKIQDEIAADRIEGRELPKGFDPGDFQGETPYELKQDGVGVCYDVFSDRYFTSSQAEIDDAINQVNQEMIHQGYADLNMFYGLIGLSDVPYGEKVGWTSDHLMGVRYSYVPAKDGSPCMAVSFKSEPSPAFHKFWG